MSWERELQGIEEAIRNLNAQYDAFLYGSSSRPPLENRRRLQSMIRRLVGAESDSAAERFRLTTLQGRYNTLCERWDRLQSEKEAGRRPGVYGHFTASLPNAPSARSVQTIEEDSAPASFERGLFERYVQAKRSRGEEVGGYVFERFVENLAREREKLRARFGDAEVEFDVTEKDGRVRLVARRKA